MSTILTSIAPAWKVLLVGLLLGAGLPALFAVGMRLQSVGLSADGSPNESVNPGIGARVGAIACFAIVLLVVAAAIVVLAGSKAFLARFGLS